MEPQFKRGFLEMCVLATLAHGSLSEYAQEHGGRTRKYYTITEQGRQQLAEFAQEEQAIQEILAYVLKGAAK